MAFVIDDNLIWGSTMFTTVIFSVLALDFPLRAGTGNKVAPATVWAWLRAIVFPFFASISWYIMAAFAVAAGNSGTSVLYYYYYMFFIVYLVVGMALTVYLALHPIVGAVEGTETLE